MPESSGRESGLHCCSFKPIESPFKALIFDAVSRLDGIELTDRGTEFCGKVEQHDCQLYLAINDIEYTKCWHSRY